MSGRHAKGKAKREPGAFLALPSAVLDSPHFTGLTPKAVKLLVDLGSQYRGDNNGDLTAAWKVMRKRGWRSEETLNSAKQELIGKGFLFETRKGRRPNVCSLYALTWFSLDPDSKHDVEPRAFPYGAWRHGTPLGWGQRALRATKNLVPNTTVVAGTTPVATKSLAQELHLLRAA